ncbi:MAG TPA: bifunctional lysine ketoglutarate reductase /saccharopine dehydrogenase family protein [Candidatus Polarisedimenticolaceae bacterium]
MIGIRREDKNRWERRVPLTPDHVAVLRREHGVEVRVQPSPLRCYPDPAYRAVGAEVAEDLAGCGVVLGVKEVPLDRMIAGTTYVYFAHVLKGQPSNMPMLRRLMDLGCSLVDYEKVTDDRGRRLIFFGRHAGYAGMIDTLHALGRRLEREGIETPFAAIRLAHEYADLDEVRDALDRVGDAIRHDGIPPELHPLVVGITGTGNVSQGAIEMFSELPWEDVSPDDLADLAGDRDRPRNILYRVVLDGADRVAREDGAPYDDADFRANPARYRNTMARHLPYLTVLVNGIYWAPGMPRVASKEELRALWSGPTPPRLRVIGDISCDLEGSIEATMRITTPGDPFFVWNPDTDRETSGIEGKGPVILAVDNLPCEIPVDASQYFGDALVRFIPALGRCDFDAPLDSLALPPEIRRALILHRGRLTPEFAYLERHVDAEAPRRGGSA